MTAPLNELVEMARPAVADLARFARAVDGAPVLTTIVQSCEAAALEWALAETGGMVGKAAALLGLPERTLRRKMRSADVEKEPFRRAARAAAKAAKLQAPAVASAETAGAP